MAPEPPASDDVQSIIRSVLRLSRQCRRRLKHGASAPLRFVVMNS